MQSLFGSEDQVVLENILMAFVNYSAVGYLSFKPSKCFYCLIRSFSVWFVCVRRLIMQDIYTGPTRPPTVLLRSRPTNLLLHFNLLVWKPNTTFKMKTIHFKRGHFPAVPPIYVKLAPLPNEQDPGSPAWITNDVPKSERQKTLFIPELNTHAAIITKSSSLSLAVN